MKVIPPQYIEYLNFEDKRNLMFEIKRTSNIAKKYSTWCVIFYFAFTGFFGWTFAVGILGFWGGDNFADRFIALFVITVLLIVSTLMGDYMEFRYIVGAIVIQTICMALTSSHCRPFCIANVVAIILYIRILRCLPMYQALEEQEGFPYFLDNQQMGR